MKKYINILKGIGLCENSAKIYLGLLELGLANITEIANITTLHRTQIYRLLPNLVESGFVLESSNGKRKFYSPINPEKINDEYNKLINNNKNSIYELKDKFNNINKKTNVIFKRGLSGIKGVYNDIVNTLGKGDVFYRITGETNLDKIKSYYQPSDYLKKRYEKKIERYIITSEKTAKEKKPKLEREIKVIRNNIDAFDDNISFTIYDDKISLIDYNTETSIIIESAEIANFQKKIFKLLFKNL